MSADLNAAKRIFSEAWEHVRAKGFEWEVEWQRKTDMAKFSESDLLRESAWVILCSGFRESVVRKAFNNISLCFCDWESAKVILESKSACINTASYYINNKKKLEAIVNVSEHINNVGFEHLKTSIMDNPIFELQKLPFIGPITVMHLAKNIGLNVAKPDRHLVRIAKKLGYTSAGELCSVLAETSGETIKVVDLVIWRYLAGFSNKTVQSTN